MIELNGNTARDAAFIALNCPIRSIILLHNVVPGCCIKVQIINGRGERDDLQRCGK